MAAPSSGKTTFIKKHRFYNRVKLVDFGPLLRKKRPFKLFIEKLYARHLINDELGSELFIKDEEYHSHLINYLRKMKIPIATFGRIGPDNIEDYPDIRFITVLPPLDLHKKYLDNRVNRKKNSIWKNFDIVIVKRNELENYSKKKNVRIYESFEKALNVEAFAQTHSVE